jgi:hypothetical protein
MATLDADQLTDFRGDIGDDGTVFTAAELHRFYTRAESDYAKAVVLALRQLLANAAKFNDYRIAQSAENKSQVFTHLRELLTYWEARAESASQVKIVGMRSVPPREKDVPNA